MAQPKLSIVIITLNEAQRLPLLLTDLKAQSFQDFEIIHVDSQSEDATIEISKRYSTDFPRYRIIEMKDRGVSLGRNTGAQVATGERILFLDADTRLSSSFLSDSIFELDLQNRGVGIVLMSADGLQRRHALGYFAFNLGIRLTSRFFPTAIGACLFSTPQIHSAIGGFDRDITLCEDCNYVLKAWHENRDSLCVLRTPFRFDPRRLDQDGMLGTGTVYLRANLRRFLLGEMRNQEIPYQFGHYQ